MRKTRGEAGFTLIDVLFTVAIIGTLSAIAMPGLFRARAQAGTAGALGSLRVINGGQLSYAISCGSGFYAPGLRTLGTAPAGSQQAFVPADLGTGNVVIKNNYRIQMSATAQPSAPASCNGVGPGLGGVGYRAGADSIAPDFPVHFSTNTTAAMWVGGPAPLYATTGEAIGPPGGTLVK
ncbi:MAG: type II secretion system protein [Vicinamibacterales bacterium]